MRADGDIGGWIAQRLAIVRQSLREALGGRWNHLRQTDGVGKALGQGIKRGLFAHDRQLQRFGLAVLGCSCLQQVSVATREGKQPLLAHLTDGIAALPLGQDVTRDKVRQVPGPGAVI